MIFQTAWFFGNVHIICKGSSFAKEKTKSLGTGWGVADL